ncbi:hypothetical protein RQP46_008418 [Phenoliferia psychrophenolica]
MALVLPILLHSPSTPTLVEIIMTLEDTSKPEGRPQTIARPAWFGSSINPAVPMAGSEDSPNPIKTETARREVTLPPGIGKMEFELAMDDLRSLIGAEHVQINDGPLNDGSYYNVPLSHDTYALLERDYFVPCAVVAPGSTADVQAVVKWANKWLIPLWVISIGRNLGYGGSACRVPGSLLVNVGKRLNKVLSVDENAATCLLQPGVTYIDLYEDLKRRGLGDKLWIDVPDLGGGSVIGNTLDRGVGYTPMGDHFAAHCGLEVVLPNGEIVRTGMDAMPGTNCGQSFQYGFGPSHDGIFSQSNFGIVTRMGLFLMPNPGGILPFMITFPEKEDLVAAVDILRPMMLNRTLGNVPSLRMGLWDAATYGSKDKYWPENAGRPVPEDIEDRIVKEAGLGHWVFYGALYGPDSVTAPTWEVVKSKFTPIKNLFFAPISPVNGADALKQVEMCKKRCVEYGFDYLANIVTILFDRSKPEERKRAEQLIRLLISDAAQLGYGEYRTHIALYDQVAATYNWNDNAIMKLNNTLKDALDVNGIMQPGRSGIWPKKYRGQGWELDGVRPPKDPRSVGGKL